MKNTKKLENLRQDLFDQKMMNNKVITGGFCCTCKSYKTVMPDGSSQNDCTPENTFSIRRS